MILILLSSFIGNNLLERILSALILISSLGGLFLGYILFLMGLVPDPGAFFFGCILASCVMAVLALKKPKFDIVSAITPVYAGIIFYGMGISPSVLLQILYIGTLVVLLVRMHTRFS